MRFKEFLQWSEEDKGLMGFGPVDTELRKPSDGQPFAKFLGPVSGGLARRSSGGAAPAGGGAMFMKKKMKKA